MTTLTLDGRDPLLVVAGSFNPAIFSSFWVATNVFDIPEGSDMSVLEVTAQLGPQAMFRLSFVNGVALNVTPNRLELFSDRPVESVYQCVEDALDKIFELLPHTPVRGLGCNFRWTESNPSSDTINLFDTPEGLEGRFNIISRQSSAQIELDFAILNLTRAYQEDEIEIKFNYHRAVSDVGECRAVLKGLISHDLKHCTEVVSEVYGYKNLLKIGFLNQEDGENFNGESKN